VTSVRAQPLRARPLRDATTLCLLGVPPEAVARRLALTTDERQALARVPVPAWSADPDRLPRLLQAALEASPGTTALLLAVTDFAALCAAATQTEALVDIVQGRALIPDLVAPLAAKCLTGPALDVWALEAAGRGAAPVPAPGQVRVTCALVQAAAGAEAWSADAAQALSTRGFEGLVTWAAAEDATRRLSPTERGWVAVGRGAHRGRLERLEAPLADLLRWIGEGRAESEVSAHLLEGDDLDADTVSELLREWSADGLLALG
jgi:hypothetical protein